MEKRRLPFITILYGIATILVILGHSHPLHGAAPKLLREDVRGFLYVFHMPLFFMISGILSRYTAGNRDVMKWWKRKAKKLLIPYVFLTLLAWLPKFLLAGYVNDNMEWSFYNICRVLLAPRENIWGHFWFIPTFLILNLLCALFQKGLGILKAERRVFRTYVLKWGGVVGALCLTLFPLKITWFGIEDICVFWFYMLLGSCVCEYAVEKDKYDFVSLPVMIIAFALAVWLYRFSGSAFSRTLSCLLMLYFTLSLSVAITRLSKSRAASFLDYVGRHAFTIFVYSWPMQAVAEMVLTIVLKVRWFVTYPVMFATGLCGPLFLYEFYSRRMRRNEFFDALLGVNQ